MNHYKREKVCAAQSLKISNFLGKCRRLQKHVRQFSGNLVKYFSHCDFSKLSATSVLQRIFVVSECSRDVRRPTGWWNWKVKRVNILQSVSDQKSIGLWEHSIWTYWTHRWDTKHNGEQVWSYRGLNAALFTCQATKLQPHPTHSKVKLNSITFSNAVRSLKTKSKCLSIE